ncbi:MAG: hypothetical protein QF463_08150 [Vicinamibacterales bacterium]|jgi:hypothetical protein|nr:hypothetical protein [Acidobacteriota bacterium]MDP6371328.1 hypothetical protein [Vicinamibacterales bacterium]MBU21576.1 hypothetical protein [Acidobacteriota bacterium]MDP6609023.1 hypothetical protein [Vicinamibacterales bacterium]MDP7471518.1 hypothetical protein [Vicinamibacterales bacterium]|tara:strand:- start:1181 stop:2173 length:993 start_codon:yes stop_codon:yes gene_type:complete
MFPRRRFAAALVPLLVLAAAGCAAPADPPQAVTDAPVTEVESDSVGAAMTTGLVSSTFACDSVASCSGASRFNEALCGTIDDPSGRTWTIPAEVNTSGATCVDIYNDCTGDGDNPDYLAQLSTVVVDGEGAEITATLFGDNFFELYVNGQYVCRDAIGFTPFNSSASRFQAAYPITYAVRLIDWGTHLGIGMEYDSYNVGDGGFIARFSDGAVTGADWRCQVFYAAPVDDVNCVGANRDTSACPREPECVGDPESCSALHWAVPDDWAAPGFDDTDWPAVSLYAADDVTRTPGYANYAELFGEAEFIWTKNLNIDNQVLCRVTIDAPASP